MYFKLNIHRKYILIGNPSIDKPKNIMVPYLMGPYPLYMDFKRVLDNTNGTNVKYRKTIKKPVDSISIILAGRPDSNPMTHIYSDKFMLFNAST